MKIRQKRPINLTIAIQDPIPMHLGQKKTKKIESNKKQKQKILRQNLRQKNKKTKQIILRQKNKIEQMQNQIRKITNKIDSERHLLKNKIMAQQLQYQLKKNQIAAQMSKRQIILKRLDIVRCVNQKQQKIDKIKKKSQNAYRNISSNANSQKSQQERNQEQQKNKKSIQKTKRNIISIYPSNYNKTDKLERLKQVMNKQKEYGNRVQRQFVHNRSKSALSYLQIKRMEELRKSQKQEERQRILQQMKKPNIPIKINAKVDKKKQIDRIRSSSQPIQQRLLLLNYMSQVELNRARLKSIRGKQEDLDTLTHLNRARTSIILGRQ